MQKRYRAPRSVLFLSPCRSNARYFLQSKIRGKPADSTFIRCLCVRKHLDGASEKDDPHARSRQPLVNTPAARSHPVGVGAPDDPQALFPADLPSGISTTAPHLCLLLLEKGDREAVDEECMPSHIDLPSSHLHSNSAPFPFGSSDERQIARVVEGADPYK